MKKLINELKMLFSIVLLMRSFDIMPNCELKKQFAKFLISELSKQID